MKKVLSIIVILFLIDFSILSQSFCDGYENGYKKGYCHNDVGCVAPPSPCGVPTIGGSNDYQHGYNDGFAKGQSDKASKKSSSSTRSSGAYSNPKRVTTDYNKQQESINELNNSIIDATGNIASSINANISENSGNLLSLEGVDLNGYKYFVIKKIKSFKESHLPKVYQKMEKRLVKKGFIVIVDSIKYGVKFPQHLENNLNLGIYSDLIIEKTGYWWQADFKVYRYDNKLIHHRTQRFDNLGIVNESMEPFLAHPYSFDESKVVLQSDIDSQNKSAILENKKSIALKKVKESKELLELGIITNEEYEEVLNEATSNDKPRYH